MQTGMGLSNLESRGLSASTQVLILSPRKMYPSKLNRFKHSLEICDVLDYSVTFARVPGLHLKLQTVSGSARNTRNSGGVQFRVPNLGIPMRSHFGFAVNK